VHRLDRLTSGVLIFSRSPSKVTELQEKIQAHEVTKEYVCRVRGEFPE